MIIRRVLLTLDTIGRFLIQTVRYYVVLALTMGRRPPIHWFERRIYSQNGEDGIIHYLFRKIGETNRYYVEIGAGDGLQCNTRFLKRQGWRGIQVDAMTRKDIKRHFVNAENIETILTKYDVPMRFDLLSIDIDGNDYWVWQAISRYKPRVVVIEYNGLLGPNASLVMPYNPDHVWDGSDYFGASLSALAHLGRTKKYRLVGTDARGVNAFFVATDEVGDRFALGPLATLYHPPLYAPYSQSHRPFVKV